MLASRTRGFTLIEIAIVLIIIGLVVGSITVGTELIHAARIRQSISQFQSFETATMAFKNKYNGLPGDLVGAEQYWPIDTDCTLAHRPSLTNTCNGNGDGIIGTSPSNPNDINGGNREWFLYWQHLSLAGLIAGKYPGSVPHSNGWPIWRSTPSNSGNIANAPAGKLPGSVWAFSPTRYPAASFFASPFTHFMVLARSGYDGNMGYPVNNGYILTPMQAYEIDTKMDDGVPSTGLVRGPEPGNSNFYPDCTTSAVASTARYNTTYTDAACDLLLGNKF